MPTQSADTTPAPIFRQQAVANVRQQLHGEILLARPLSFSALTLLFVAIAASIVAFFMLFGYTRKVQVVGTITPITGVSRIVATQPGIIVERKVVEGQPVAAGEVLFVLSSERVSAALGDAEGAVSTALAARRANFITEQAQASSQARQRTEAIGRRIRDLTAEIARIDGQIVLQQRRLALAQDALKRYNDLASVNFVSKAQLQDKTIDLIDQQQRLHDLERAKAAAGRDLSAARDEVQEQQAQARRDELALQRSITAVDQDLAENEARRRILIRAPQSGSVAGMTAEMGQSVTTNQALAALVPAGADLEAELYAPSRAIGFVRPGLPVLIRYQAFPYQKFGQHGGRIREVSRTSLRPDELSTLGLNPQSPGGESLYRVRVALDRPTVQAYGTAQALKPGMALEASIVLEERKLYEWVLEPLFSISGRLGS